MYASWIEEIKSHRHLLQAFLKTRVETKIGEKIVALSRFPQSQFKEQVTQELLKVQKAVAQLSDDALIGSKKPRNPGKANLNF